MSVERMSLVWSKKMPPAEKLVLLTIADCCNDDGVSVLDVLSVAEKCCVSTDFVVSVANRYSDLTEKSGLH